MSWHIDFTAASKADAIKALMHPMAQQSRGLPIAIREQVIVMIEGLSDEDPHTFIRVHTHGHIGSPRSGGSANMTIEVSLTPTYVLPPSSRERHEPHEPA